jgi:hypothetical protein
LRTVLLVEDSKLLRVKKEHILKKAGYQVVVAVDGIDALNVARDNPRPDPTGYDVAQARRSIGAASLESRRSDLANSRGCGDGPFLKERRKIASDGAAAFVGRTNCSEATSRFFT